MKKGGVRVGKVIVLGAAMVGCFTVWQDPARAGSDNSTDTYAGDDVTVLSLPSGTLLASEYFGLQHGNTYVTTEKNIFNKLVGGQKEIPSTIDVHTSISRLTYVTSFFWGPLALSAAAPVTIADEYNVGKLPQPVGGLGSQTIGQASPIRGLTSATVRSWGGDQVASGGVLETIFSGPTPLGRDDFVKGHMQAAIGLHDFQIAADVTHDFERSGGVKEEFTGEVRLTKLFIPQAEPLK